MEDAPPTAEDLRSQLAGTSERRRALRKQMLDSLLPNATQAFLLSLAELLEAGQEKTPAGAALRGASARLRSLVANARRFERGPFTPTAEKKT